MLTKKKARRTLRKRLRGLSARDIFRKSYAACLKLLRTEQWRTAEMVMLYQAMPGELDATHAILESLRLGKRVAVPRIDWSDHSIHPVEIETLNHAITVDRHGIREPRDGAPLAVETLDLVAVPGLGFDRACRRLGRGSAFYDRFLSQAGFRAATLGIAFEEQLLPEIPVESHDRLVDGLITDRAIRMR